MTVKSFNNSHALSCRLKLTKESKKFLNLCIEACDYCWNVVFKKMKKNHHLFAYFFTYKCFPFYFEDWMASELDRLRSKYERLSLVPYDIIKSYIYSMTTKIKNYQMEIIDDVGIELNMLMMCKLYHNFFCGDKLPCQLVLDTDHSFQEKIRPVKITKMPGEKFYIQIHDC